MIRNPSASGKEMYYRTIIKKHFNFKLHELLNPRMYGRTNLQAVNFEYLKKNSHKPGAF